MLSPAMKKIKFTHDFMDGIDEERSWIIWSDGNIDLVKRYAYLFCSFLSILGGVYVIVAKCKVHIK